MAASSQSAPQVDAVVQRVRSNAAAFARLTVPERIELLQAVRRNYFAIADSVSRAACAAKGLDPASELLGEERLADPLLVLRNLRLLIQSLQDIQKYGAPRFKSSWVRRQPNGRLALRVFPYEPLDAALLAKHEAWVHFQPDIQTEEDIQRRQAAFYRQPHGGKLVAVLGAGNVNSIPPTDSLYKMFVEGMVCVLKMNPVNDYAGRYVEQAFQPLIDRGFFGTVYGGADVGGALVNHPLVDELHMTGSDRTHDLMVWGPQGPERETRKAKNEPLLTKRFTSELGNITPIFIVPGTYSDAELDYQARNVAGMATHNASFDCTSAKLLVLSEEWPQRELFMGKLAGELARIPPRKPYYPGASERWKQFTDARANVRLIGEAKGEELPWALIRGLDPTHRDERVFRQESWCAILSETAVRGGDPESFLANAVGFVNESVWGTLCTTLVVPHSVHKDPRQSAALDRAVTELRYGTVALNTWSSVCFAAGVTPWGGHPSSTLQNIQSGQGFVHNTLMLDGVEKVFLRSPLKMFPVPPWFPNHRSLADLGRRLVELEYAPSWLKVPAIAATALRA